MKKRNKLYILFFLTAFRLWSQQDPQYSQYMFSQVIINPAYIGTKDAINVTALTKKQWVNINGAPQTNNISVSGFRYKNASFGGHISQETIGPVQRVSAYADYCYRLRFNKGTLSAALSAGVFSNKFNFTKITFQDENEPLLYASSANNFISPDVNAGLFYKLPNFYLGLSATHLTGTSLLKDQPGANTYYLARHFFISSGYAFSLNSNVVFNPAIMLRTTNAKTINADVNASVLLKKKLWLGLSYRTSGSIVALTQVVVTSKLKVGYSYDYGIRGVSNVSSGSHELMISYDFGLGKSGIVSPMFL